MIIKKFLVCFICSIVPYISKGQCLDSLKRVCLPDSIAEQIENSYEDKYTNASKNVVNLISPNNYNLPQFGIRIVHKKVGSLTNILYLYR